MGPMFRHERPQKGRTRQFHQIGAEVFGAPGPDVDVELLAMGRRLWRALGLKDLRLEINSLGQADERARYREALVAFLDGHRDELDTDSLQRLERNPLRILDSKDPRVQALLAEAPLFSDFLESESRAHFDGLRHLLDRLAIPYEVNPRLVRGLDYYCHTVFEWITGDLGAQGTICAGGRYDGLVELQGGKPWPATGFALGMERVVALLEDQGSPSANEPDVYLVLAGSPARLAGMELAERLRDELPSLAVVCNAGGGSFKSQFKRADRSGALLAFVLGDDELASHRITLKYLREDRPQEQVAIDLLGDWLRHWLANGGEARGGQARGDEQQDPGAGSSRI
jgi:histidyl-tRNA synthetase